MLAIAVILGLFLYLKFFFFLAVVLLIAGANLPEQIAEDLNISKIPIVLALVALVGIGADQLRRQADADRPRAQAAARRARRASSALFYAIEKNNLVYAQKVLSMNFDPNLHHDNGYTPLAYAAMKGSQPMVELLLRNGADPTATTKEGDTPVELALRFGARRGRRPAQARPPGGEPTPTDARRGAARPRKPARKTALRQVDFGASIWSYPVPSRCTGR